MPIRLDEHASGEYSQHGEEGAIDAVFHEIGVTSRTCVEFGAFDLKRFSNVYSLWNNGWRAVLIEGDPDRFAKVRDQAAAEAGEATSRLQLVNRFVAQAGTDSLDSILAEYGMPTDLDLLSIDVDGLEWHIWRGMQRFRPRLVVVEYNPTIPPHIELVGSGGGNDIGSSALALARLGADKGYSLIGCIGWNAFFVEREHASHFASADDLEALFDYSYIRYAMQSYNGEVFYSEPLLFSYWPLLRRDSDAIEKSSVPLGRIRPTVPGLAEIVARHYLRPVKREYLRARVAWSHRDADDSLWRAWRAARVPYQG